MKKLLWILFISALLLGIWFFTKSLLSSPTVPQETQQAVLGDTTTPSPTISPSIAPEVTEELPTEIPTPEETKQPVAYVSPISTTTSPAPLPPLTAITPSVLTTKSGSITTLEIPTIKKETLYKISLSEFSAPTFVVSWPYTARLHWTTKDNARLSDLLPLPIDEKEDYFETENHSGLLEIPLNKVLYLYSSQPIDLLKVTLIDPKDSDDDFSLQATTTGVYNFNAGASYSNVGVVTRDIWGANPSSWDSNSSANIDSSSRFVWYPVYYKASRIVVHHTATNPTSTPAAAVRGIYLYHTYVRNWGDIGYNFLIDQNGTIYQGKLGGDETQGYHAFGAANRTSIGIALIGNFTSTQPTAKARQSLIYLMAERAAFFGFSLKYSDGAVSKWRDPSFTVFGHRDSYAWDTSSNSWKINATACPGNAFKPKLPAIVAEAETYRKNNFSQLKSLTTAVNVSYANLGLIAPSSVQFFVKYNVPEDTPPSTIESYLPAYSGITSYSISGNKVVITVQSTTVTHPRYGDSEYLLPPFNWKGYNNEYATYSPAYSLNGPEDRAKTLLKIFKLDPRVEAADFEHTLSTQ